MPDNLPAREPPNDVATSIQAELEASTKSRKRRIAHKFLMAAIGSIPWVGGFLAAAASITTDESSAKAEGLRTQWLEEHQGKLENLQDTLEQVQERFDNIGPGIDERIQSPEYLSLVRQAFRTWD